MNTFAVASPVSSMPQVALIGTEATRHECWDDAVQHVCANLRCSRGALWCRNLQGAMGLFDTASPWPDRSRPVARILTPVEYQAAKSRGDLESGHFGPCEVVHRHEEFRRAGDRTPARQPTQTTTMKKASNDQTDKPSNGEYLVVQPVLWDGKFRKAGETLKLGGGSEVSRVAWLREGKIRVPTEEERKAKNARLGKAVYVVNCAHTIWRGRRYVQGQLLEAEPRNKGEHLSLTLYREKGWLRVATDEERNAPPTVPAPDPGRDQREVSAGLAPASGAAVQVQPVAITQIRPDPTQPRRDFSPESMAELVASVKVQGVEQAILVRPMSRWRQIVSYVAREWARGGGKPGGPPARPLVATDFWGAGLKVNQGELIDQGSVVARLVAERRAERGAGGIVPTAGALAAPTGDRSLPGESEWLEIVYGERRWRAAQEAGLTEIPAKVRELSDVEAAEKQAVENLDRADLAPLEVAAQYRKLLDLPGYGMARLMETTGHAKNTIYGKLKLLDLPEEGRDAVAARVLNVVTAERLGRLGPRVQERALKAILHPKPYQVDDGKKVPNDRVCRQLINDAEKEVACEERWEKAREAALARGVKPLAGKELEDETTYHENGDPGHNSRYVSGSQRCHAHPQNWTWGKLLGKAAADLPKFLGRDRKGDGHEWMLRAQAEAKVAALGVKLVKGGGSSSSSGVSASEKLRAAAERKRRQLEVQAQNAGLAEIVAAVERTDPGRLPAAFWRELAATAAHDSWSDTTRRISTRRGNGVKGRANETLEKQAASMDLRQAVALLAEVITVGLRGSQAMNGKIERMRALLGLANAAKNGANGKAEKGSASVRTTAKHERQEALI